MTLGQRIKDARTKAGLTQVRLAEQLHVSRQAVSKWEADRGLPDIENLRTLARLFGVSVDDLLVDLPLRPQPYTERLDLTTFEKPAKLGPRADTVVLERFPQATRIWHLGRLKLLTPIQKLFDIFVLSPGTLELGDALGNRDHCYLIEQEGSDLLVTISQDRLTCEPLMGRFEGTEFVIGNHRYRRVPRPLKG